MTRMLGLYGKESESSGNDTISSIYSQWLQPTLQPITVFFGPG